MVASAGSATDEEGVMSFMRSSGKLIRKSRGISFHRWLSLPKPPMKQEFHLTQNQINYWIEIILGVKDDKKADDDGEGKSMPSVASAGSAADGALMKS